MSYKITEWTQIKEDSLNLIVSRIQRKLSNRGVVHESNTKLIHGCTEIWDFSLSTQIDISLVRYRVEQSKRNSISPSNHVLFYFIIR